MGAGTQARLGAGTHARRGAWGDWHHLHHCITHAPGNGHLVGTASAPLRPLHHPATHGWIVGRRRPLPSGGAARMAWHVKWHTCKTVLLCCESLPDPLPVDWVQSWWRGLVDGRECERPSVVHGAWHVKWHPPKLLAWCSLLFSPLILPASAHRVALARTNEVVALKASNPHRWHVKWHPPKLLAWCITSYPALRARAPCLTMRDPRARARSLVKRGAEAKIAAEAAKRVADTAKRVADMAAHLAAEAEADAEAASRAATGIAAWDRAR
jgi:hypothetical protein